MDERRQGRHADRCDHIRLPGFSGGHSPPPAGETDSAFVQRIYAGAIGCPAYAGGLAFWDDLLAHGSSRAAVATTIARSPEAQTHLAGHIEAGWHLA